VLFTIALPKKTTSLATKWDQPWLGDVASQLTAFTNRLPAFSLLLEWIGFALAGYVVALVMLALRHRRPGLFGWGFATLALAATSLHLFAWFGFIAYHVARFVLMVFEAVTDFVRWLLTPVVNFVVFLASGALGWLSLTALIAMFVWLTVRFGVPFLRGLGIALGLIALCVGVIIGAGYLLRMVPSTFWETVLAIFTVVVLWLLWLLLLTTIGQLFLDQLRGTFRAGSGQRGVIMGAISVGSALALLMLLGNAYGAYDFYPDKVAAWAGATVRGANAPQFDAAIALVLIGFSGLAVLTSLVHLRSAPPVRAVGQSLIYAIIGGVIAASMSAASRD
jgi:hypothetical protein